MSNVTRRTVLKSGALVAAGLSTSSLFGVHMSIASTKPAPELVRIASKKGALSAHVYVPRNATDSKRRPGVVVAGSLTSVKEQMSGSYAAEMARRGFVSVAIDYSHYGRSSGEPRQYEHPETKTEDLMAVVSYLTSRSEVVPDQLTALGICTSGGNVCYLAARDPRIQAIGCVASHFAEPAITPTLYGGEEGVARRRAAGRAARAKYDRTGVCDMIPAYSNVDPTASHVGPMEYYMDKNRGGGVPQWKNEFAVMSWEPWLDFNPVREAAKVSAATIIVHSDDCALPAQARKIHAAVKGRKSLHWTAGPHFDFYDDPTKMQEASDVVAEFFRTQLA